METSKELYQQMLGLGSDWEVTSVDLNLMREEVKLRLTHLNKQGCCSECNMTGKVYDYSSEKRWKHLDTMQFSTVIEAKTPRIKCSKCEKVKSANLPWA